MKTTLTKKLLKFFLPLLVIPIVLMLVFYYMYFTHMSKDETIQHAKNHFAGISHDIEKHPSDDALQEHLHEEYEQNTIRVTIIDKDLNIIADADKNRTAKPYTKHEKVLAKHIDEVLHSGDVSLVSYEDYELMIKPLINSNNEIFAFAVCDYKNALDKKMAIIDQTFVFIVLIIIFISFINIILTIIFSFNITNPIKSLIEGTNIISAGDRSHRINISSDDEVGSLADSFNNMIEELRDSEKRVNELNHNLESKVKEQVEELREKDRAIMQKENEHRELKLAEERANLAHTAKSSFLANMSHEIRTPMNAIVGFINILIKNETSKEKLSQLSIVKESGDALLDIINDILDFSKIESGKLSIDKSLFRTREPFVIVAKLFYEKAQEKNIKLNIVYDEHLPPRAFGDTTRIKQVYANLLSNAIKFSPKDNHIYIKIMFDKEKKMLVCSVKDNGIGIKPENLTKIFTAFEQEDSSITRIYGGTGLGLSISKTLVKLMGGNIEAKSEFNEGSSFSFSIDIFSNIPERELKKEPEVQSDETQYNAKVLIVEDNKTNQLLLTTLLEEFGLDIVVANDGLEGIEACRKEQFSLILMDENMPNMNGIIATEYIRELEADRLSKTPIIAVTANALVEDRKRFLDAGMDDYLSKPINHKELQRVLARFLSI